MTEKMRTHTQPYVHTGPIDANVLEALAKQRPGEILLNSQGILTLLGGIRQLEAEIHQLKAAPQAEPQQPRTDEELALDLLAHLFDAYEGGVQYYEDPEGLTGFIGHAFRLDNDTFHACADLLNRRRPVQHQSARKVPAAEQPADEVVAPPELAQSCPVSTRVIFSRLIDAMEQDNGGPFGFNDADFREAAPAINDLVKAGFFLDDPFDLDGSYWQCIGGDHHETLKYFERAADAYARLDVVLNRIFDGHPLPDGEVSAKQPADAVDSDVRKALHRVLVLQGLHRDSPTYQRAIAAGRELLGLPADSSAATQGEPETFGDLLTISGLRDYIPTHDLAHLNAAIRFSDLRHEALLKARAAPTQVDAGAELAKVWDAVYSRIEEYVEGYEMHGEDELGREGYYTPTKSERGLILDAMHGLFADDEFSDALWYALAAQGGQQAEPQHDGDFWRDAVPAWVERHGIGNLMTWDQAKAAIVDALKTFAAHPPRAQGDKEMLDFMERHRVFVTPEYEGPWEARVYGDHEKPSITGVGKTPRAALADAIARQDGKDGSA